MKYEDACQLSPPDFKRRFGVQPETFEMMLDVLQAAQPSQPVGQFKNEVHKREA